MVKIHMEKTHHSLISDGVEEAEQTLSIMKPFWVFFVGNIGIGSWLFGVIIAGMGLNFSQAMVILALSTLIGSAIPAATAILGPLTRLSQMEAGRLALGSVGKKLTAFLNWIGTIGWDVVNNILSSAAFVALLTGFGIDAPLWLALGILVLLQLIIGVFGHHLIQETSRYTGLFLGVMFVVIGMVAMHTITGTPAHDAHASVKDMLSAFVLLMACCAVSWTTCSADYTRYLPRETPRWKVFLSVYLGQFVSFSLMVFSGYITATAIAEQTPAGVMKALQELTGQFSPLVLFAVAFNSIPLNAINDNSAAYSLMSAGVKLSRPVSAIFGAVLGYIVCLFASSSFVDFYENFLFLFAHWIMPWVAILMVHWFTLGKHGQTTPHGITRGCIIFVATSAASIGLFSANSLYTGLLSDLVGGVDIGPYIGFVVAGAVYYASLRLWPHHAKAMT